MEKMESFVDSSCVLETGSWGIDDWVEGRTLACNPTLNRIVKDMLKSGYAYAVLPVPKLDENQEDYMFGVYDHFWGVPTTSYSNMEFVATVTEALQCAHYNKVLPAYYDTILNGRLAECREDAQVLSMIPSRIYLNPGIAIGTNAFKLDNLLLNAKGGKTASTVATVSKSITKQINSFVKKINAIVEDQE